MATIDVSSHRTDFLADKVLLQQLPPELLQIIRSHNPTNFLDAVAAAALIPQATHHVFAYFETIFADISARWLLRSRNEGQEDRIIAAFARILPFAPYLSVFLEQYISETSGANEMNLTKSKINSLDAPHIDKSPAEKLVPILLAVWRLLNFDKKTFRQHVQPSHMQALFKNPRLSVRYLAIRIFCQLLAASDLKLDALLREHVESNQGAGDSLIDDIDGQELDLTFLSLFEQQRARELDALRHDVKTSSREIPVERFQLQNLTPLTVCYGSTVIPRPLGAAKSPSALVLTPTTLTNLEGLSQCLQQSGPILLHGLPGSGKTSSVQEMARELGMDSTMVTLHLNEQTDAKMLIGLYSTDSKPGSFSWRPGVITTAVKEGRWVLIEDLDRAPNEVMSTLLPLVERGELIIPSRGERIQAPSGFRLFATVRTTKGMNGQEGLPTLLGQRFWHSLAVKMPTSGELETIILGTYPMLHRFLPHIIAVYNRLRSLPTRSSMVAGRGISDRPVTPRDLMKWCRRLNELLIVAGCKSGDEPITETIKDWMFMEAVDCFCGSIPNLEVKTVLVAGIAREMHMPPERVEHYLRAHIPPLEEHSKIFRVGRASLTRRPNRVVKSRKPFANTSHAKRLLEQIAVAIKLREPVLLVGETGIGKTTVVQQLADSLGHKLVAVNLSQQSEVGDLLGGFKPVNVRSLAVPLKEEFEDLFACTGIAADKNKKYLEQLGKSMAKGQWVRVSKLWREAPKMFKKIVSERQKREATANGAAAEHEPVVKRRKTASKLQSLLDLRPRWEAFEQSLDQFDVQISGGSGTFAFAFVEGNIVKAARNGDWVLLDEINLASPDTLESIADLLASGPNDEPSILLSETGEIERVKAHPEFRIFGAMNPATDVGKRDLPLGLRSRFTELYVSSPDKDLKDLLIIIKAYLKENSRTDEQAADNIARLYLKTKQLADEKRLVDGAGEVPHFSLRTLTRVLSYVDEIAPIYGLHRSLYEGFSMGFLTLLSKESEDILVPEIRHYLLENHGNTKYTVKSLLSQPPKRPRDDKQYVQFQNKDRNRHYWLLQGNEIPRAREDYIITRSIERNLLNLVRATSTRRFPVLIQGPTSSGKTSMIEYLADFSGNKFVRINNHEHTDLQEYLGTYVSGSDGKLRFQEGLLVQALRQGHWIVLDELNLAPTDVLEALNRLLDDNRELLIPETQEIVRPHENFMLFATQNPPGLYGGRKMLSRAFRNRFLELHFDDIPEDELETILQRRSVYTAPSDCERIVKVYKELSRLRQTSRLFENKDSFATLRDLFRWALRGAAIRVPTSPGASPREEMANHGYMLLAERVRNEEERVEVKQVIENVFKVQIEADRLYDASKSPYLTRLGSTQNTHGVVWTHAMRRLYVLVAQALVNDEPVLLVGETGCGKTTVCQLLAEALGKELHIVNAHQNTETGDLIGSQRPVRNRAAVADVLLQDLAQVFTLLEQDLDGDVDILQRYHSLAASDLSRIPEDVQGRIAMNEVKSKALFEWADGSLVHAMKNGSFFLLDEISLADDSVLERLNSVLEPQRTLLLAEKGIDNSFIKANEGFQFFATMNPGGDFGKKELSPALRNRFTEIWVPALSDSRDVSQIVSSKLKPEFQDFAAVIVDFSYWFGRQFRSTASTAFSIRDILVWVKFINESRTMEGVSALIHGASTVFIDTLGANPSALIAADPRNMDSQRQQCLDRLSQLLKRDATKIYRASLHLSVEANALRIGDFSIARVANDNFEAGFALHAPTTKLNAMRVIRALQVQKPILLEGSPGVGKTTLIGALARACGQPLTRINLSDQTDLMDLFGTDVPIEGAEAGHFAWRDAPFLRAMQNGEWVLLDEMNLASQSVLEGLNACLDHRGEVYISELDQTFKRHPDFRLFAAQNPHHQGGGRKGLPSSFVNRFIVVYADVFSEDDLLLIAQHNFPGVPTDTVKRLITFISKLDEELVVGRSFGTQGAPWEFNLRDTLRWLHLLTSTDPLLATGKVDDFLDVVIRQRFRTTRDREGVDNLFTEVFESHPKKHQLYHNRSSSSVQFGLALMPRNPLLQPSSLPCIDEVSRLSEIESVLICVKQSLPCIIAGPSGSGKSALLEHVASLLGRSLVIFPMNADIDTMDLVGGFEQHDPLREVNVSLQELLEALQRSAVGILPEAAPDVALDLLNRLEGLDGQTYEPEDILQKVRALQDQISLDSELAALLSNVESLLMRSTAIRDPTFEWLDGIIVQALQRGQWLVLDNANLCSSSVLDRLNSLLEPDGSLIINEHCGPNGEPRIVKPHPDFRVFLTVDPRYGELSRAMRNRAIEIHIDLHDRERPGYLPMISQVESKLRRFELLNSAVTAEATEFASGTHFSHLAADILSSSDMTLFKKYRQHYKHQLVRRGPRAMAEDKWSGIWLQSLERLVSFVGSQSPLRDDIQHTTHNMYTSLSESISPGLSDVQPLHPLQNSSMMPLLHGAATGLPMWLATCHELFLDLVKAKSELESQGRVSSSQPSALTRLQRSCIAGRVAGLKDSTVHAAKFLQGTLDAIETFVRAQLMSPVFWKERKYFLKAIMHYWWRTFHVLSKDPGQLDRFNEARFQAHLTQGAQTLSRFISQTTDTTAQELASYLLGGLEESFVAGFKLSTGLSMEPLWRAFKPIPVTSIEMRSRIDQMENLAQQFDWLRWDTRATIDEITKVTSSLVEAYRFIRNDEPNCGNLLKTVDLEMKQLLARPPGKLRRTPLLAPEFEHLRQLAVLDAISEQRALSPEVNEVVVLSNLPIIVQMRLHGGSSTSQPLHSIGYLMGSHHVFRPEFDRPATQMHPWTENLSTMVFSRLDSIGSANLQSLQLLEEELPALASQIAKSSEAVTNDALDKLEDGLLALIKSAVAALGEEFSANFALLQQRLVETLETSPPNMDKDGLVFNTQQQIPEADNASTPEIVSQHFVPAMVSLWAANKGTQPRRAYLANAWVQFAIALIKLYVPDKMYDPQLRPLVELQSYDELQTELTTQLAALQRFETFFTGQPTNFRAQLLEEEILNLGARPDGFQTVYRDTHSPASLKEFRELQGEFNGLLKSVLGADITAAFFQHCFGSGNASQQLHVIRENVLQILSRMTNRGFREFEDLKVPVVNIVHCLEIGISLADGAVVLNATKTMPATALLDVVPFVGGIINRSTEKKTTMDGLDLLAYAGTMSSVEGVCSADSSMRRTVFQAIHSLYEQWSQKLESDRVVEQQKKSMYRYRGGLDKAEAAEKEDFQELFPSFDNDEAQSIGNPRINDAQSMAVRLAEVHEAIFSSPHDPAESIKDLCKLAMRRVSNGDKSQVSDRTLLPATILILGEKLAEFNSATTAASYNFYTDANIPEARRLVALVNNVRARFRELQQFDEIGHMQPLEDVIVACDNVLELSHSEPLARIIMRLERLHGFVYEWQFGGWASKVHQVLPLYNQLTDMLVGWRRVELSTWANLFDVEARKCEDDAKSWWFVAYQAIIAGPMSLAQSGESLQDHAANLLRELETYFSSAVIGQFAGRLKLLRQLQKQLDILILDWPSMSVIRNALQNFVGFYAHFEKVVQETIQRGRAPIDKKMKDVLLLASWKDTNIAALRESARRSHEKLFRLVKKLRDILGQSLKTIIDQGLPDEEYSDYKDGKAHANIVVDQGALLQCESSIPSWTTDYKRLANVQKTVEIMTKIGRVPGTSVDAADEITSFLSDLSTSIIELRKATPPFLTEENKEQVKHLKSRKRKLFAEILRDVREMGFHYNLGVDDLTQQDSLSKVLAESDYMGSHVKSTEYYFHKTLDFAPRIRNAAQTHSEELTGAEISRGIGFLEGILHAILIQRRALSAAYKDIEALEKSTEKISALATSRNSEPIQKTKRSTNVPKVSLWIVHILDVGRQLVELHGKFGGINNGTVLKMLKSWIDTMSPFPSKWRAIKDLPPGLVSVERLAIEDEVIALLNNIEQELQSACKDRPDLAFLFEQVRMWTSFDEQLVEHPEARDDSQDVLFSAVKRLSDSVLVAVEQFSKAIAKLPTSDEDPGWLVKYDAAMAMSVKALHIDKIEKQVEATMAAFSQLHLDNPKVNNLASSLLATVSPILQRYQSTCQEIVSKYANLHHSTCKMACALNKNFVQLASQGFCTPLEKSEEKSGETGELESGQGLGDGEGADDISKDIQPDEDLSELAQEKNKESKEDELENEKDAVDMADEDMEGDIGSVDAEEDDEKGSKSGDEEDGEDDIDEEAGNVDDLDPTAVDEKMWDGENDDEAEKDQQGEKSKGKEKKDEQMAADQKPDNKDAQPEDTSDEGEEDKEDKEDLDAEQDEDVQFDETNHQDQNVQDQDTLALPDDMAIDGKDDESMSSISDTELDDLSDVDQEEEQDTKEQGENSDMESESGEAADMTIPAEDDRNEDDEKDENSDDDDNANIQEDQEMDLDPEANEVLPEEQEKAEKPSMNEAETDTANVAPSDVRNGGQDDDPNQDQDNSDNNTSQRENGEMGDNAADQDASSSGNKGTLSQSQEQPAQSEMEDAKDDSSTKQPFRALGDALEKWHRQQREIKEASQSDESQQQQQQSGEKPDPTEQEMASKEFQHLQNDDSAADTQAIGTATEEESRPFDDTMAIDDENEAQDKRVMPETEEPKQGVDNDEDDDKMDTSEPVESQSKQETQKDDSRTGVSTRQGNWDATPPPQGIERDEQGEEMVEETSVQLSSTHLSEPDEVMKDFGESMQQWTAFQTKTNPLSLSLTSQLRLILTPSQSTKLSGSYRTGKRLNIKRIIPYIASSYKRDKIWMRRAIPTKRSYQILLCVDDSKSMGESSSGNLALESLVMVSRALSMLEVGQIGVLGFGANTFMAHEFNEPFASHDAGAKALQRFSFQQDTTDIRLLVRETIARFRQARLQNPGHGGDDLWQLALILSDGLTPSNEHEDIRRLLREAMEDRIMVVFIVMDDTANKKKDSVLNLRKVQFVKDAIGNLTGDMKMDYYLDSFPFQYYLIVHNLEDLPGALAGLLRTWFAEVNA
ncbi:uncharacterized protein BCR38DRAFT_480765 [Pseudomassariella vexata]|uniref:Midasin n=1 Tax=Pseudomassariella vexata TaxID=1141098 RepID=A0A1Y2EE47_9PEZI|nr:uncharacterized protein BCR38DRAFT_480765 [Pseudomassariella vexata]ORY69584.1 hypothetical protein BCR38DRAFT_480765 [Pseudomassariella vexata]